MIKILVINPNSSAVMTDAIKNNISINRTSVHLDFYTAPVDSPCEINNEADAYLSSKSVLKDLLSNKNYLDYDGYLVSCYSDHPLIESLKPHLNSRQYVMGIFQASMLYSLNNAKSKRSTILTSGRDWELTLDKAIIKFLGTGNQQLPPMFGNTSSVGLTPLQLENPENYRIICQKIKDLSSNGISCILLGCAGLSSLQSNLKRDFPQLTFVDGVKVGIHFLISYISIGEI